ncbi:MAG TPA: response regulator transcription factor [Caldilineae bacterium]|nr:response regulator transcription factor [Caldilineae bacterium]
MATTVLLIGHGVFHDGLERLLAEQPHMSIIGTAGNWDEAQQVIAREQPDVLIVEQESANLYEDNLGPLLDMKGDALTIIYLTLTESKMVIHDRQQVNGATVDNLLEILQTTSNRSASGRPTSSDRSFA